MSIDSRSSGSRWTGAILLLVVVNLLWAVNPVMAKFALADFSPLQVSWLRLTGATLTIGALWPILRRRQPVLAMGAGVRVYGPLLLGGVVAFYATPLLAMHGLDRSLATHSAFITGLEPVSTIIFARVMLGERLRAAQWGILALAVAGFALLSGLLNDWAGIVGATYLAGNTLLLLATFGESLYSVIGGGLVSRVGPYRVLMTALLTGWVCLTVHLASAGALPRWDAAGAHARLGIVWVGLVTTAFCYYVWFGALQTIPVNLAAFTLFVQPVAGGMLGHLILSERPTVLEWLGGAVIVLALSIHVGMIARAARIGAGVDNATDG